MEVPLILENQNFTASLLEVKPIH